MRTFKGDLSIKMRIVVPDEFLSTLRHQATILEPIETEEGTIPAATPFLLRAQEMHPTNDDAFLEMILSSGLRIGTREAILLQLQMGGLGGTVSPATVNFTAQPRDENGLLVEFDAPANPVTPEKTDA